ncbi:MAG: histidine kinase [Anaerolineae bacterium]
MANPSHEADLSRRIRELEARLADLKARLPAHSVPPAMWEELEELEEELARLQRAARSAGEKPGGIQP